MRLPVHVLSGQVTAMINEKRAVERFEFFIVVEFKPAKEQAEPCLGITRNFSREGFSFESRDFDLEPGQTLEFTFKQPRSDLMVTVQGEIIWRERTDKLQCLTGIKLRDADDNKLWKIMEIVSAAGIATSGFFDNEDTSAGIIKGNGEGQDVFKENELPSEEPVHGNGQVAAEAETVKNREPEAAVLPVIKTGDKPETGPATLRKKKVSIFIPLAAFAIGILLFIIVMEYNFENFKPAFLKPSLTEEATQKLQSPDNEALQEETFPGDTGPLLQKTGPEGSNALTEQDEAPDAYMTDAEKAAAHATDEMQPVSAPEDLREVSATGDAVPPQSATGREENQLLPEKEKGPDVIPPVDDEVSLPEIGEKQPLLLAGELVKERPVIQKSEQNDLYESVSDKDSGPVETEKTGDTALLSPEIQKIKEKYEKAMQIAIVPDTITSEENEPVTGENEKEPGPAPPVTAGESTTETDIEVIDSSVQYAGEETTAETEGDLHVDTGKTFSYTHEMKDEEKASAILRETESGEEIEDRSALDSAAVLQDDEGSQTAALYETQSIKKEKIDILEELFDNNNSNWDVFNTFAASADIQDGEYRIENKRKKGAHFTFSHHDFPHDRDFITEVDIKPEKTIYSHSYGFVLGAQDAYNNYIFRVLNNRYYLISKYHKGVLENLSGGTIEKGVVRKDEFNTLKIEKRGSTMRFFVNDQFIDEISRFSFDGNKIGFVLEGQLKISVDRIHSRIISY